MALNPIWTVYDPLADCTVDAIAGVLNIAIPAGTTHDLWTSDKNAPRVTQVSLDTDFIIDIKVDSTPIADASVGIVAVQDNNNMILFGFEYSGGSLRMVGSEIVAGTGSELVDVTIAMPTFPFYARLKRIDDNWECYSAPDGTTWTKRGATIVRAFTIAQAGMFATTSGTNPAWTALIDSFTVDNLSPIVEAVDFYSNISIGNSFSSTVDFDAEFSSGADVSGLFDAEVISDAPVEAGFSAALIVGALFDATVIEIIIRSWTVQPESGDEWTIQSQATDQTVA